MTFRSNYARSQQTNTAIHEANKPIQLRKSEAAPSTSSAKSTALDTKQFYTVYIPYIDIVHVSQLMACISSPVGRVERTGNIK
jgi:hypothetical protein